MIISKVLLRKFIHEVTGIITFDCRDNYSDTQHKSMCKVKSTQETKNARGARGAAFAVMFSQKSFATCFP